MHKKLTSNEWSLIKSQFDQSMLINRRLEFLLGKKFHKSVYKHDLLVSNNALKNIMSRLDDLAWEQFTYLPRALNKILNKNKDKKSLIYGNKNESK